MEASIVALIPVLVQVITNQLREDLLHMLMGTKCCKWSKNKVRKLHEMLVAIEPDIDAIQETVRRLSAPISSDASELEYDEYILNIINKIWPQRTEI